MRILFITSRLPYPPNRGDRLRAFNFIRILSRKHEIHLITFISKSKEKKHLTKLSNYCKQIHTISKHPAQSVITVGFNIWRSDPLQISYYRSSRMQSLIDSYINDNHFDVIYIHLFRMTPYLSNHSQIYRIVDLTDVISNELRLSMPYRNKISRLIYKLEIPRIEQIERWVTHHFEETWLISDQDRSLLFKQCPRSNIQVVRNGVDTNRLYPTGVNENRNSLLFLGHMGIFHNIDAVLFLVKDILPLVEKVIPDVTVKIVGASPTRPIKALASLERVEVTGFISDLNDVLNRSTIFVAPLRFASGIQNKVLEAMAAGRPIVTTTLVNQGIGAIPGRDFLTADTPLEIANAILKLFGDEDLRMKLGSSARKFVINNYRWELVGKRLADIQDNISK